MTSAAVGQVVSVQPGNQRSRRVVERYVTEDEVGVETAWMLDGSCRDSRPGTFFPSDGLGVEAAQRICAQCQVRLECLEYALTHRIEHGVWGGASERERRRILRARRELTPSTS